MGVIQQAVNQAIGTGSILRTLDPKVRAKAKTDEELGRLNKRHDIVAGELEKLPEDGSGLPEVKSLWDELEEINKSKYALNPTEMNRAQLELSKKQDYALYRTSMINESKQKQKSMFKNYPQLLGTARDGTNSINKTKQMVDELNSKRSNTPSPLRDPRTILDKLKEKKDGNK